MFLKDANNFTVNKASTLTTARTINGTSFSGSANITTANWGTARTLTVGNASKSVNGSGNVSWSLSEIGAAASGHTHNYAGSSSAGGAANSATKLATARTINGTSFDGSANITTANWGTARTLTIGDTAKSVNGSANVSWSLSEIGAAASNHTHSNYASTSHTHSSLTGTTGSTTAPSTGTGVMRYDYNVSSANAGTLPNNNNANGILTLNTHSGNYYNQLGFSSNGNLYYRAFIGKALDTTTAWKQIAFTDSNITGNAATATKLQTVRTINGTNFDGTGNITTANWGTARTITIGSTGKSVNGSGNVSWSLSEIGAAAASHTHNYAGSSSAGGNANAAVKLATARTINGTSFNGSADITTASWGTARNISIADNDGTNTGTAVSVNGSANVALKLPATIKASLTGNASTATRLQTARSINGTSFDGSGNITTANWGTARNIQIGNTSKSVNGSANISWTLDEVGAASRSPFSNTYKQITVGGDANTYYPVLITMNRPGIGYPWYNISISRAYNATAPDTWNTATHKGGLTFQFRWSGDNGWGGNDHNLQVVEFSESYTTMVAGFTLSVNGIIVWLRGGGALYQLNCEQGIGINATVTLGTYTSADNKTYPVRTNTSSVANEIHKLWVQRGGEVYDNNSRVYSANNKPTPAAIGAAPALAFANSHYGMVTNDGNSSNWIRTTQNGIIPYQSGGSSSLGTSGWPFSTVYATNFYGTLNGNATHWGGRQVWWGAAGSRPGNGYIQFVW